MCKKYNPMPHIEIRVLGDFTPYVFEVSEPLDCGAIRGVVPVWWALAILGGCKG
jgi:hypothetical protein